MGGNLEQLDGCAEVLSLCPLCFIMQVVDSGRDSSPPVPPMHEVTRILSAIELGDGQAADRLFPLVYEELRTLATQWLAQEKPGQTLQATGLVHEAYLRLVNVDHAQHWNNRRHFFGAAAQAMRRILVENARQKKAQKRGGDFRRVDVEVVDVAARHAR